jgi:hypothetical protein
MKNNTILEIYKLPKTVFTLKEIALILNIDNFNNLKAKINYYVKKKMLLSVRKGIYVKPNYDPWELACKLYTPSYISLETILQKEGIIFQYSQNITGISYLSRNIKIENHNIVYRKIKNSLLLNSTGINILDNQSIASKERAVLDCLYLYGDFYFDNISNIDKVKLSKLAIIYNSPILLKRIERMYANG